MNRKSFRIYSVVLTLLVGTASTCLLASAQVSGNCERALAEAYLDVANVRARILNNGNLFWRSDPNTYEVPKGGGVNPIFSSSIWIAGLVDSEVRAAATRYGPYEFWAGPIGDDGSAPADCGPFDRIWTINRSDIVMYDSSGAAGPNLLAWPSGLGAPTLSPRNRDGSPTDTDGVDNDSDGTVDEPGELRSITDEILSLPVAQRVNRVIDLDAGERPDITGDQMLWWIMNDVGNAHGATKSKPIGIEVHASAFAFDRPGDIGNTTFFRHRVYYKGASKLTDAYFGVFVDSDLGMFADDYVASDSTLGLAITYNGDNDDEGNTGYGIAPPALGLDFVRGPIVESLGDTAFVSGQRVAGFKNLQMTSFMNLSGGGGPFGDPNEGSEYYNYMQAKWKNGTPLTEGDWGSTSGNPPIGFAYPGDAANYEYWSELNVDGQGTPAQPSDRMWVAATGPFEVTGELVQEVLFAIVWTRGADNLDSYRVLKTVDRKIQNLSDNGFSFSKEPDAPDVTVASLDNRIVLSWTNPVESNNFSDAYREFNADAHPDYPYAEFEGYEVWEFDTAGDNWPECVGERRCRLLKVFDIVNGITNPRFDEDNDGVDEYVARGTDSGIRHMFVVDSLVNYQSSFFGVRAYAYSATASPPIIRSAFARVEAVPTKSIGSVAPEALAASADADSADIVADGFGLGSGTFSINVVDPTAIRACNYRVVFYESSATTLSYDVFCGDEKVVDGEARPFRLGDNLGVFDGLEYSIHGPASGIRDFTVVANANGPLDPYVMGTFAFNANGFPLYEGQDRPRMQQVNGTTWGIAAGGGESATYEVFQSRVIRGDNLKRIGIYDYEMRFTSEGGKARREFEDFAIVDVPFELWRTGINTPDDSSDDVRLIPFVCETACGAGAIDGRFDIGGDHSVSGGPDDPFSDYVYWNLPADTDAGQAGYDKYFAGEFSGTQELFARTVLVNWNGGDSPPYDAALPEEGTIFRITTNKPIQPGDSFTFSTHGYEPTERTTEEKVAALADVGIVPNPYYGASLYERTNQSDEVRFTALPQEATIRVFTLNGTLVRTLRKNSSEGWLPWDLKNEYGRPLASGLYLVHVDVPGVGSKVVKFSMAAKGR